MPSDAALVWGQQDVMMTGFNDAGYWIEASADGTNWGNPEAVVTAVRSRLQDGSLAEVTSQDNREAPIQLRVRGEHYDGLVAGEEALVAETRREGYNTLSYLPPVEDAATTVFDVVYSVLDYALNDLNEKRLERQYTATMTCLPFPRAAEETVAAAVPSAATETKVNIDDGSSATGWSATTASSAGVTTPTVTTSAGAVRASRTAITDLVAIGMKKTASIGSLGTTPYILFDWTFSGGTIYGVSAGGTTTGGAVALEKINETASPTAGFTRTCFKVPAGVTSLSDVSLSVTTNSGTSASRSLSIDTVDRTDTVPAIGTRRQLSRTLPVAGSVRTQGRLSIQHETTSLGETLVYVYKDDGGGDSPSMRAYRTSGGTVTTDSALYSGGYDNLNTKVVFDKSVSLLAKGAYRVLGRVSKASPATVTLTLTADTRLNSTNLPGGTTWTSTLAVPSAFGIFDMGGLSLPTTLVPDSSGATLRLTIEDLADTNVLLDDVWLFNLDIGTLTHIVCGSGTAAVGGPSKRLWLDPATVTNDGQDAIFRGHSADRSDAFNPAETIKGWTPPQFEPPSMKVFTACNALDVAVDLSHYRRGLHHIRAVAAD